MSRRHASSEVSDSVISERPRHRHRDRDRDHESLRPRRGEERFFEEDIEYSRRLPSRDPPRQRDAVVREDIRARERSPPEFLRDDYGRTGAGPMVLRKRETEDFEFVARPRRRSPSPPSPPRPDREEIIIRKNEGRPRAASPGRDREEVIIRRGDRESDFGGRSRRDLEPEEVIIRDGGRSGRGGRGRDDEEVIIRDGGRGGRGRGEEEVIIRDGGRGGRGRGEEEVIIRDGGRGGRGRDEEEVIIRDGGRGGRGRDEEEIIILGGGRDGGRGGRGRDDEEVIIRDGGGRRGGTEIDFERDEVVSRRGDRYDRGPPRDFEEVVIARGGDRDRESRYDRGARVDDLALVRPISHERERSRSGRGGDSEEIVIRNGDGRGGAGEEIIIRKNERERSPSSASSGTRIVERDRKIRAPDIHQNVITHHRHVYYDDPIIERSRPPSPPVPPLPPPPVREDEMIEIHRRGERNGHAFDEDIIIDRNTAVEPRRPPPREEYDAAYETPTRRRPMDSRDERDLQEEAEYYNQRALERAYVGEGYGGATKDWAIVDVPPGTRRVKMDGAGGGSQEVTWQRYNGVRRSKFMPDGVGSDEGYGSEIARPAAGGAGPRYQGVKDPTEGLWTEITKDLVSKEAIEEAGYEYEETEDFYYVIAYMKYEDIARLVGLSEDIRQARRRRIKEMDWERRALPPPVEERRETLMIEEAPRRREALPWDREEERYIEREVVVRGGRGYR